MKAKIKWIQTALTLTFFGMTFLGCSKADKPMLVGMAETREIMVASKLAGRLAKVEVAEGDTVEEGDIVATINSPELDAKVEQARGMLKSAEARLSMARKGARIEEIRMAETALAQASEARKLAETTWKRVSKLLADSVIPRQQADEAEFKWRSAQENETQAMTRLEMMRNGARSEEVSALEGAVQSARNALSEAQSWSRETVVYSPVGGVVQRRYLGAGEIAMAGAPILVLIRPEETWIALPVREDHLGSFQVGKAVWGEVPALAGKKLEFRVAWISAMGDYATWRSTSRKGDSDLRSFEIRLEPAHMELGLLPGMTVRFGI